MPAPTASNPFLLSLMGSLGSVALPFTSIPGTACGYSFSRSSNAAQEVRSSATAKSATKTKPTHGRKPQVVPLTLRMTLTNFTTTTTASSNGGRKRARKGKVSFAGDHALPDESEYAQPSFLRRLFSRRHRQQRC